MLLRSQWKAFSLTFYINKSTTSPNSWDKKFERNFKITAYSTSFSFLRNSFIVLGQTYSSDDSNRPSIFKNKRTTTTQRCTSAESKILVEKIKNTYLMRQWFAIITSFVLHHKSFSNNIIGTKRRYFITDHVYFKWNSMFFPLFFKWIISKFKKKNFTD